MKSCQVDNSKGRSRQKLGEKTMVMVKIPTRIGKSYMAQKKKKKKQAKMHFWSLHFGSILNLVLILISLLGQSLISETRFYFGPCCQPSNIKCIYGKQNALFADLANKIIIINYIQHFLNATLAFKLIKQSQLRNFFF